jgi:hypothetical protein
LQKELFHCFPVLLSEITKLIDPKDEKQLSYYYELFPNHHQLESNWKIFSNFYNFLKENIIYYNFEILYSPVFGWVSFREAIIIDDQIENHFLDSLENFLIQEKKYYVKIPHALNMILKDNILQLVN